GFILAFGLVIIAIPLGGILAFLMVRTDLPGRRIIEPLILVPIFGAPSVFATFVMRQFFIALPAELEEAARVDGLSRLKI
ncbi:hypothetical protein K4G94_23185, partial [Mycobacterium tuberculosis]|nr:hypothetical protein [Mycobacterium tuberculosis]